MSWGATGTQQTKKSVLHSTRCITGTMITVCVRGTSTKFSKIASLTLDASHTLATSIDTYQVAESTKNTITIASLQSTSKLLYTQPSQNLNPVHKHKPIVQMTCLICPASSAMWAETTLKSWPASFSAPPAFMLTQTGQPISPQLILASKQLPREQAVEVLPAMVGYCWGS